MPSAIQNRVAAGPSLGAEAGSEAVRSKVADSVPEAAPYTTVAFLQAIGYELMRSGIHSSLVLRDSLFIRTADSITTTAVAAVAMIQSCG